MKTILIVEDHADIRKLIRMTLETEEYAIHEATDGDSGQHMMQTIRPDLILLDVMLPGKVDGLQLCKNIKSDDALKHTPVVLLTARGQVGDREAGLAAGASAYLAKPFSPLQLIDTIEHWLQST